MTSIALLGLALPLTGDIERQVGEARIFMSSIGGTPFPEGTELDDERTRDARRGADARWVSGADAETLRDFLLEIGFDKGFGGMKLAKIREKGFLWVSAEEAAAHAEEIPNLVYDPPVTATPSGS